MAAERPEWRLAQPFGQERPEWQLSARSGSWFSPRGADRGSLAGSPPGVAKRSGGGTSRQLLAPASRNGGPQGGGGRRGDA